MDISQFLTSFESPKKSGTGWMVKCPSHPDSTASLAIGQGQDGRIVMFCHAGCETKTIVAALGIDIKELFPPQEPVKSNIVATYDYRDLDGTLLHQTVRFFPKDFRQRMPDGGGGWIWKTSKRRVPYRWPELVGHSTIYIVEGEKDADALWAIGIPATCNLGGAGKWGIKETQCLTEIGVTRVIVLPDNDNPGIKHAQEISTRMKNPGIACSIVILPGLSNHGDVCDWLKEGGTALMLAALVNNEPSTSQQLLQAPQVNISGDDPSRYNLTDLGAAEAFRDRYHEQLRFDHQRNQWLVWHDHFWEPDAFAECERLAQSHIRLWQQEAVALPASNPRRSSLVDFTLKLERSGAMANFMNVAKSLLPIATTGAEWDRDSWLLGCRNGVVDLRTGILSDGDPSDHITKQLNAEQDKSASCPRWLQFLYEVFESNYELIHYVTKAVGYSLTADMREQCFFMAVGSGANGKSIFLDTLEHVFASYSHRAPMRLFASNEGDADRFSLADLQNARIVFAAETKANTRMNEHTIKALTGGETLSGERKYGQPFTFRPTAKIWLGVNHNPTVSDDSFGFWRRVRLIPFNRTFSGTTDDRDLRDTLRKEADGIFAWALQGCLDWQSEGMIAPEIVTKATKVYEIEEDPLTEFLNECTENDPEAVVLFSSLYSEYKVWAKTQGILQRNQITAKAMGNNLKKRGYSIVTQAADRRYHGLRILDRQAINTLFARSNIVGDYDT